MINNNKIKKMKLQIQFNIARILTSIFSAFGAFWAIYYFLIIIYRDDKAALVTAFFLAVFYEFFAVSLLSDAFKQFFEKNIKLFIISGFVAVVLYFGSFFLTVNGISQFIEKQTNRAGEIIINTDNEKKTVSVNFDKKILEINKKIDSIYKIKENWINRKILQNKVNFLHLQLVELQMKKDTVIKQKTIQKNEKLQKNGKFVASAKNKYYFVSAILMFSILLFNLMFNYLKYGKLRLQKKTADEQIFATVDNVGVNIDIEVKRLLKAGVSNKEICKRMGLKPYQVSRIKNK